MAHIHPVIDDDKHFIINPDTRKIEFAGETMPTLIQFDHNSERFTFEIPEEIDGHDMTLCNKVQVHFINVNKDNPEEFNPSIYESTDLGPNEAGDKLVFTWLIDQSATLLAGPLNFALRFMCTSEEENEDGEIEVVLDYSWNTHPHEGVFVSNGFDNNEILSNKYYEVVDQWYATIEGAATEAINEINAVKTAALQVASSEYESFKTRVNTVATEGVKKVSDSNVAAVKSVQNAERMAVDNIDQHADHVIENWRDTQIAMDILHDVDELRQDVANLAKNTTRCKTGVLYGEHSNSSYNTRFMNTYGNTYKSSYLIGESGGPFIISHDYGSKPMSIKQVLLLHTESSAGGYEFASLVFEWLTPFFYDEVATGMSYTNSVGYVDDDDNIYYSDPSGTKSVAYPSEQVFIIEPGTPYISTGKLDITGKHNTIGHCLNASFIAPIFLGDKRWRAVEHVSVNDIQHYDDSQDMSGTVEVFIDASYLIISPTPNTNFTIRQCSTGTSEFTLKANGITGIIGPVERNLEDEYTIVLDNGTTKSFKVPNGNSAGIRTKASGQIVRCDDVIDVEHTVKVTARSKNIIPFTGPNSYISSKSNGDPHTSRGVKYTVNPDGSITCKGTTTVTDGGNGFSSFQLANDLSGILKDGVSYYVGSSSLLLFAYKDNTGATKYVHGGQSTSNPFTWSDEYTFVSLYIQIGSSNVATVVDETVYPYIYVDDGVSRDFVPYVDIDDNVITRCGKNLISYPYAYGTGNIAGVTYTVNNDGAVIATGTATDNSIQYMIGSNSLLTLLPGTYTLSGCPAGGGQNTYRVCIKTTDTTPGYYYDTGNGITFTLTETKYVMIYVFVGLGTSVHNLTFKPQLEVGSKITEYECGTLSYQYDVDADGKPTERISSTAPTMTIRPDTQNVILDVEYNRDCSALAGSGGGYDETTLEALTDDVEALERRVGVLEANGGNSGENTPYDCSSGYMEGSYESTKYLKITVPNKATIFDLTIKQDIDGGGSAVGQYDFVTWRLHLSGNFCSDQCSTLIQDASKDIPTLYYTTDDSNIYIYLGYTGNSVEAYIKGIIEKISATFESIDSLPSDAVKFTMNNPGSGSGSGGGKFYHHKVIVNDNNADFWVPLNFYSTSPTPVTNVNDIPFDRITYPYYQSWGYYPDDPEVMINGGGPYFILGVYSSDNRIGVDWGDYTLTGPGAVWMDSYTITDTVTEV